METCRPRIAATSHSGQHPIDAVVHLAWFGVTAEFRNSPQQISQNLVSTLAIWEAAKAAGCKVWVGLGSQAEYGPCSGVLREDMFPRPVTAYGVAKLAAGLTTAKMSELADIRHVWLRLLSAYGPGDDERHMLPSVILDLTDGQEAGADTSASRSGITYTSMTPLRRSAPSSSGR